MTRNKKILLIEDNKIAQFIAQKNISEWGFEVDVAGSEEETINLLKKNKESDYGLVFMDLGLPDTDGFELTKKIREEKLLNSSVPIVALTAHQEEAYREKAKNYGMDGFFVKPLTLAMAKEILEKFSLF